MWAAQLLREEVRCQTQRLSQAGTRAGLHARPRIVGVAQLDTHPVCKPLDRLDEAQIVDLAHEVDHVATLGARTKAVPMAARGCYLEARRLLVVKGAEPLHRPAGAAKRDVGADDFLDPGTVPYGGNVFVIDPPAHGRESISG